ncbi:unnamed protein product [Effrenium voratum]|uniref:STAS domain-containing protein n=2 Tax=Effrenium voratum TaxID=2562239 RepID=A0AA36NDP5_9DINO|nr:unnamed protein product [Effrenium voratum]CAJ1413743.1 unnamed protein product [Effrenium voratum]
MRRRCLRSLAIGCVLAAHSLRGAVGAFLVPTPPPRVGFTGRHASRREGPVPASQLEDLVANAKSMIFAVVPQGPQAEIPRNIMAGFAVALAMIPESVAFAFVVGVTPIAGLWSAVCLGFLAAAFGGRPGIASGAAGSTAVVMAALVDSHGISYLSAAVMLAGIMQITVGVLRWGKFIKLVPHPVMLGFVNGLAIVIANAQLSHFFDPATGALLAGAKGASMLGLTALSMALVKLLPRLTTAVPSSLLTVVLITVLTKVFHLPAQTLSDIAGAETFRGGLSVLPHFGLAQVPWGSWQTWRVLLPYSATMAAVGLIESLLTLQLVDGLMDDGKRGDTRKECIGQGLGNIASGLTGGMGGCAMIGQTQVNIQAGARGRLAGISMALLLGLGIVAAAPALGQVPVAALVGIMFVVCESTFAWSSLRLMRKIPRSDAATVVIVSLVTVWQDLADGVVVGTIVSALCFCWKQSTNLWVETSEGYSGFIKTYKLHGLLFFGSTQSFADLFRIQEDPQEVVLDFAASRVLDHSALEAINNVAAKYGELGKTLHLVHLSSDCAGLLERLNSGTMPPYEIIEVDEATDPIYEVAEESRYYRDLKAPDAPKRKDGQADVSLDEEDEDFDDTEDPEAWEDDLR